MKTKLSFLLILIAIPAVLGYLLSYLALDQQSRASKVINLAGRQRMLIQTISKDAALFQSAVNREKARERLNSISSLFELTLLGLIQGNEKIGLPASHNPIILQQLNQVQKLWRPLKKNLNNLLAQSENSESQLQVILEENEELLRESDLVVTLFEWENAEHVGNLKKTHLGISLMVVLFLGLGYWFVNRAITDPLLKIVEFMEELSRGVLNKRLPNTNRDEIGMMSCSINNFVEFLEQKVRIATAVGQGELSNKVKLVSEEDVLGLALKRMVEHLQEKVDLAQSVAAGDLSREVVLAGEQDELGKALQKMVNSLNQKSEVAHAVALGDLTIDVELASEKDQLGMALQKMIFGVSQKIKVAQAVAGGNLSMTVKLNSAQDALGLALQIMIESLQCQENRNQLQLKENRKNTDLALQYAKGNFTQKVELFSKDDTLGKALQTMWQDFNKTMSGITQHAKGLHHSAEEYFLLFSQLAESSEHMQRNAGFIEQLSTAMTEKISSTAESTEEMSTHVKKISSATQHFQETIHMISGHVEQVSQTSRNVEGKSNQATSIAEDASKQSIEVTLSIQNLSQAANEIAGVSEMIKEVSSQTNLLALNAHIEAATAGEAGRGFSVVANEIKALALQSGEAAKGITKKIDGIQDNTGIAVSKIEQMSETIHHLRTSSLEISQLAKKQTGRTSDIEQRIKASTEDLAKIVEVIEDMNERSHRVSTNSIELSEDSQKVHKALQEVTQKILKMTADIKIAQERSKDLASMADQQELMMENFSLAEEFLISSHSNQGSGNLSN